MEHDVAVRLSKAQLPAALVWGVVLLCVLPFCLSLAGIDFSTPQPPFDALQAADRPWQAVFYTPYHVLQGSFTHTLLEWSAFCTAIFTVFLALVHFSLRRDATTLLIGIALFGAGIMDAFHTLAAARLLHAGTDSQDFMPFTWAVCRLFHAVIMMGGATLCLRTRTTTEEHVRPGSVVLVSAAFGILAYVIVYAIASAPQLPRTVFPDAIVTRPYDVVPLVLLLCAGAFVYPRLYQHTPSVFSHALIVSTLPNVAAQFHMAFGSTALFDYHFNIAHFLKIIAYLIPFSGLTLDYIRTYREEARAVEQLTAAQQRLVAYSVELEKANTDLRRHNMELDEFNYVASHDLQEPLRKLIAFSDHLRIDLGASLPARAAQDMTFIVDAARRMQALIQDLLALSRAGRMAMKYDWVGLDTCVNRALEMLQVRLQETQAMITQDPLPVVWGDMTLLTQLYQNLIDNALKFVTTARPVIRLTAEQRAQQWIFGVQDHGIGIKPEYAEQIFTPFKRLHSRAEYQGTGIGLAICRKAIERHRGTIWVESQPGQGAHFKFTLATDTSVGERTAHDTAQRQTGDHLARRG
jgi:signal transduction histidine kinase